MSDYALYWGDTHTNLHSRHLSSLDKSVRFAREMLDFWPIAYYPQEIVHDPDYFNGMPVENWHPQDRLDSEWKAICDVAAENNVPGEFVAFCGYEWQGNGTSGDHNVFHLCDHQPVIRCDTLAELYAEIRDRSIQAFAIPHHTAYMVGVRAKDWSVHDSTLSPFAEVYSVHGCSESDEEWMGLRRNAAMGPGVSGGTIEDGLNAGHRFGIICSNDSHGGFAGVYGCGIMGCYARELTRESLWEAFASRRVYGVSADRIALEFSVDDAPMGSEIESSGTARCVARVRGGDAVDRIELLRNNRVIATHCHNGTWDLPDTDGRIRCKLRLQVGWGVGRVVLSEGEDRPRTWDGTVTVPNGRIVSVEKCWTCDGQAVEEPHESRCDFRFTTAPLRTYGPPSNCQANIFEIEGRPSDPMTIELNGKRVHTTLREAMSRSRIIHYMEEAEDLVRRAVGVAPASLPRRDRLYYLGHKAKVHRAIPDAGLDAELIYTDSNPSPGVNHYRVRVSQRDGSMAWSSPVWVTP